MHNPDDKKYLSMHAIHIFAAEYAEQPGLVNWALDMAKRNKMMNTDVCLNIICEFNCFNILN